MNRIPAAAVGVALMVVAGGCSGSDDDFSSQSADKIASQAKTDMKKLTSMKVSGDLTSNGQKIGIDLQLDTDGNCTGTLSLGKGSTELLGVDGSVWMRPDKAFWKAYASSSADQIMSLVGDKWVVVPTSDDSFKQFCDLDDLLDEMVSDDDDTTYTKGDTSDVDGNKAIAIDGKADDGTSTGYVLLDDPHYLVKMERTDGDSPGAVTFSDFDADVDAQKPSDDDVIDLSNLGS